MSVDAFDAQQFVKDLLNQAPQPGMDERAAIDSRKQALRIDLLARDEIAADNAPLTPPSYTGDVFLTQPDDTPAWRISNLWPAGGNVVLAAQFKAGKTTLRDNLIKSWCDGTPFLGHYRFIPAAGPIFVIDAEMPSTTARRWLKAQQITHPERFMYVNIRGASAAFNPIAASVRAQWVKRISGCSAVLLDCAGPVLASLGLDEGKAPDVGRFIASYEQMLAEAGVTESFVIHHMGHSAERSRGASRFRDWPDAEWRLVRQDDNPASPRYFSAFGRDVDIPESKLGYDTETRRLTITGGSRKEAETSEARAAVLDLLTSQDGLSGRAIEDALSETYGRNTVRAATTAAVKAGEVVTKPGPRNSKLHSISAPVRHSAPLTY